MHSLWDKKDHHFPNQQYVFIPLLLFLMSISRTHFQSLCIAHFQAFSILSSFSVHLWLFSHSHIYHSAPFFLLHFYAFPLNLIPHTVPPAPSSSPPPLHLVFPHFHIISLPFSPPQAVRDVSCVCRPAGPDPRMLQRERWKNPSLLQHSSPLPTVCQQRQTGVYLPNQAICLLLRFTCQLHRICHACSVNIMHMCIACLLSEMNDDFIVCNCALCKENT